MKRTPFAWCGVVVALLVPRAAAAQAEYVPEGDSPQWLKDRRYNEGIGVRTGDLELHFGAAAEAGYDSNFLLRSNRSGVVNGPSPPAPFQPAPVVPSLEFRLTPSFYVSTLGPQRREGDINAPLPDIQFRAGVNATERLFTCLGSNCSGPNDISQEGGLSGFSVAADARLDVLPERPLGFSLMANYARSIQPNLTTINPDLAFTNDTVGVGAEINGQYGTIDSHLGYQLRTILFEDQPGLGFNNLSNAITLRERWKWRPRTAFIYDGSLSFTSYTNPDLALEQGLVNSSPVRSRIGISGLVTDRFAFLGMVGYAATFNESTTITHIPQYDSPIGQVELHWFLTGNPGTSALSDLGLALSSIAVGYTRDYQASYIGNFLGSDRGYIRFNYFFAGRAVVALEGGLGAAEYPAMYWGDGTPRIRPFENTNAGFTDTRLDATLFGEYRFSNVIGVNATLRYTAEYSGIHDMPDTEALERTTLFDMEYNRFEAFLGARFFM